MRPTVIATILALAGALPLGCGGAASTPPLTGARAVSVGSTHACALLQDGTIACWGSDAFGELGQPRTFAVSTPVVVAGLAGATAVVAGTSHTCALDGAGAVSCWGNNVWAELGAGAAIAGPPGPAAGEIFVDTPSVVPGLPGPVSGLVAGGTEAADRSDLDGYTCASLVTGAVWCWGQDAFALSPIPGKVSIAPTAFPGLSGVRSMSFAGPFGCAILGDGTVACWGLGPSAPTTPSPARTLVTPVPVPGLTGATEIAAGEFFACVLLSDATVSCWGLSSPQGSDTPTSVSSLTGVTAIAAGGSDACALLDGGTVTCWGPTYGSTKAPVPIGGVTHATSLSVGGASACAVIDDGTLRCWGQNDDGQLGNGRIDAPGARATTTAVTVVAATPGAAPVDGGAPETADGPPDGQ